MTGTMALRAQKAKIGSAETGHVFSASDTIQSLIISRLRDICPKKTWAYLGALINADERTAKHRMAGTRRFSVDEIALLLRSEHGMEVLEALMDEARPQWWQCVRKAFAIGAMRRQQSQLQEAINELAQCEDALSRAETSLRISDADFHRENITALRASRRNLRGALAR